MAKRNFALMVCVCLSCCAAAFAHEPNSMLVEADNFGVMYVKVMHPVSNVRMHYVKTVEIVVGDEPAVVKTYTFQATPGFQRVMLDGVALPPKKGDAPIVVKITTSCNQGGVLVQEFKPQELGLVVK